MEVYKCLDCGKVLDRKEIVSMGFGGFACGKCGGKIVLSKNV